MSNVAEMPGQIIDLLKDNPVVSKLNQGRGTIPLASLIEEAVTIAVSFRQKPRPILVVKQNLYSAQRLYDRLSTMLDQSQCALFGMDESLRVEAIAASPEMIAGKVETLASLSDNPCQVVITCPAGILRQLPSPEHFSQACIQIHTGDTVDINALKRKLRAGGYAQASHIDQPLSFAARGGIIDVYSINYDKPVRIEFFGDEVDSIRFFDPQTQKTTSVISAVSIVPATDLIITEEEEAQILEACQRILDASHDSLLEVGLETDFDLIRSGIREPRLYPYFTLLSETFSIVDYMKQPLVILSDEDAIHENIRRLIEDTTVYIQEMVQEKKLLPKYAMWHDLSRVTEHCKLMKADPFADNISNIYELHLPNESLDVKLKLLDPKQRVLFCLNDKEIERVTAACIELKLPYEILTDGAELKPGFHICMYPLSEGFTEQSSQLTVVTANELFEIRHHVGRYEKKFRNAEAIHGYDELTPGDYVVHASYGVGQYIGIETKEVQGTTRDFLRIIYKGNAELFVPLEQFKLVRKFVSREGVVPKLNKLGSGDWEKTKARLEENVTDIADRLVDLYANREQHIGYRYQPDSELQKEFEDSFEYELTPDQAQAVIDIKKDMESDKPMDRLVCGDVGFGKTEVAIRAAFKAAAENKQVAVLCPTTILAEQHLATFTKRFKGYPVVVRVLDRFVEPARIRQTLQEVKDGVCDILIGTHRILSKDVEFKDLGLLVVDEEQRFGVEHKEKIKELKNNIDVLTLSATPIPRTLQMSLVGIRSLSQLETPPNNRYNVQTYVVEKNRGLVIDAIEKELARNGQVFYLYNHIDTIYNIARTLQSEIKDARIGVVHGRMDRETIENVMMDFNQRNLNVLVCTTIIENGIDVPNANTILIDNAQDFGLAQIYQIKGRVGRSDRVAYAYLLVPPRRQLSEVASKRLQAVKEFAKLGSGYKIAMRDLTIRGAGDLLGPNQSGFIDTVGIDMYIEMLENAIARKKGIVKPAPKEMKKAISARSSYIPKNFAPDDYDKLSMYQRIDLIDDLEKLEEFKAEVIDQYGKLPSEVNSLFEKRNLDILINGSSIDSYKEIKGNAQVTFTRQFSQNIDGIKLFKIFSELSKDIALRYTNNQIIAIVPNMKDQMAIVIKLIEQSKEAVRDES